MNTLIKNTVVQLHQKCKDNGIKKYSKLRKAELIDILRKMYTKRVISALILNRYKKPRNYIEPVPKTLQTCNICLEDTTCVKICKCTGCVCMSCLESVRKPDLCSMCRSNTEQYLRSLSNRTTLQNSALALILDRKIAPVQHVPEHIFISVGNNTHRAPFRRLPRNRERLADFVIDFVREMNEKMNTWYNDNVNRLHIHYITRNMNLYHNLIHGILRYRTPSVIRRDMQTVDNIYYNITHTHNL